MQDKHLHPLAIIFYIRSIIVPIIWLVWVQFQESFSWIWNSAAVVALLVCILVYYWNFKYSILDNQIVIKKGVIFKKQIHIPYERIQSIHHSQWFFLKPFNLEELVIENAGHDGSESKLKFSVVSEEMGQILEQKHHQALHGGTEDADTADVVGDDETSTEDAQVDAKYSIDEHDMRWFGMTSFRFFFFLLIVGRVYDSSLNVYLQKIEDGVIATIQAWSVVGIIISGIFALLLSFLISFISIWFQYYGFTLVRQNGYLIFSRGIIQTSRIKIATNRIQSVALEQNILRNWCHLVTVKIVMVSDENEKASQQQPVILPVVENAKLWATLKEFLPWLPQQKSSQSVPRKYAWWLFFRNAWWLLILVGFLAFNSWQAALAAGILVVIFMLLDTYYKYLNTGVGLTGDSKEDYLVTQTSRLFYRRTNYVDWHHIQSMEFRQSMWMPKKHLAHLVVTVRSGSSALRTEVRYVNAADAKKVYEWYQQ